MIGNVSEWTHSDYKSYPYKNDIEETQKIKIG